MSTFDSKRVPEKVKTKNTEVIFEKVMEVDCTEVRPMKGDKLNNGSEIPN